jgi:hypothetical protein
MERHAQKDGGRHLLELVSMRKGELHRCALPCVEFVDETASYFRVILRLRLRRIPFAASDSLKPLFER